MPLGPKLKNSLHAGASIDSLHIYFDELETLRY